VGEGRKEGVKTRLAALALAALLFSGCAPSVDINKRAIVTAAAVALREEGYVVTVESLSRLGREEQTYESHTGSGKTFAQAVTDMELKTGKNLYLDGCKVLLLSGFQNSRELRSLLEEIDSHGGIRPLTLVAADLGETGLLEREEEEEESIGEETFALLSGGELSQVNLKDCLGLLAEPGRGVLIPGVERLQGEVRVSGYLSPGAKGILRAPAELERLLPFAEPKGEQQRVYTVTGEGYSADWVLEKNSLKLQPKTENGELAFVLEAEVEGYLLSSQGEPEGSELLRRAQEDICKELLEEYTYLLEKIVRPSGNDLFSLGKHLELLDRKSWEVLGDTWEERLPEIPAELRGSVLLRDKKRLSGRG